MSAISLSRTVWDGNVLSCSSHEEIMSFPVTLLIVCGILIVVVLMPILICRMFLFKRRVTEFEKFCKDAEDTVWTQVNPLYKEPVTCFPNPTYIETPC